MAAHAVGEPLWTIVRGEGPPRATVLCDGARIDAEHAAFANGSLIHARAQDDTHFAAKTHVGAAIIPAALALAEETRCDGATFVRAVVAGCEVAAAIGERLAAASTARGFRSSPVFGTLGAAAASAVVLGLDAPAAADAIAIASSFSGGLNQTWIDGSSEYRLHLGMAARNGITAARMAAGGLHGAPGWYEGAAGFARAFAGEGADAGGDWELGRRWRLLDVTYKPYPVCAITQSPVQVALDLAAEHDLRPAAITAVRCHLNPADRSYPGTMNRGPYGDVAATLMSAEYCVAMALKHRSATLEGLQEFDDPTILRLVGLTDVLPDEGLPNLGARVEIETAGGEVVAGALIPDASTYGWDWDGVRANAERMLPEMAVGRERLDELTRAVRDVLELPDVEPLVRGTLA
jgi:2-methylcitrate dehydratase PrpD